MAIEMGTTVLDSKSGKSTTHAKVMGIDIGAIVKAETEAKSIPVDKKKETIDRDTKVIAAFSEFQSKVTTLRDAAAKLSNPSAISGITSSFQQKRARGTATTEGTLAGNIVAFTVESTAENQNFDLQISSVARADKCISSSAACSDVDDALSLAGTLTLGSTDNTDQTVTITADMSLTNIKDAINAVSTLSKIRASIIQVSDTDFRLNLAHTETGKKISLAQTGGVLTGLHIAESGGTDTTLSACVVFNGVNTYHPTNVITTLVDGLTIEPLSVSVGNTINVTIEPDLDATKTDIVNFVQAYNDFVDFSAEQTQRDEDQNYAPEAYLARNSLFSLLTMSIQSSIFASSIGVPTGQLQILKDIGISTESSSLSDLQNPDSLGKSLMSKLEIDDSLLNSSLMNSLDQLRQLFAFEPQVTNSNFLITSHPDTIPAALAGTSFTVAVSRTGSDYSVVFTAGAVTETGTVEEDEDGLLRLVGPTDTIFENINLGYIGNTIADGGSASTTVTLIQGIADQLNTYLNAALTAESGSFAVEKNNLDTKNKSLKAELVELNERFERDKATILQKYAKLEEVMRRHESLMNNLTSYMGALTTKNRN